MNTEMKEVAQRILVQTLGWALVILGIVGLFVPILQGILFILLGLWVLSRHSRAARRCLLKMRRKFPAADRRMKEIQRKFKRRPKKVTVQQGEGVEANDRE